MAYVTSNGDLLVAPFDEGTMTFAAPGTVVERGVRIDNWAGAALFDVSQTSHLMYAPGSEQEADRVVWVDRQGKVEPIDSEWGGPFETPSLSPDGSRLAVVVVSAGGSALWTKDVSGGLPSQLTVGRGPFGSPSWNPDSRTVAFISFSSGPPTIWQRNADGSGQAEQIPVPPAAGLFTLTWSPDGRLVYSIERVLGSVDIRAWHPDIDTTESVVVDVDGVAFVGDTQGRDTYVKAVSSMLADYYAPGSPKIEIDKVVAEGDDVVTQFTIRGNMLNGNPHENCYMTIHTFDKKGKIVQVFELMDTLHAANQWSASQ